jgi:hypothetical protein
VNFRNKFEGKIREIAKPDAPADNTAMKIFYLSQLLGKARHSGLAKTIDLSEAEAQLIPDISGIKMSMIEKLYGDELKTLRYQYDREGGEQAPCSLPAS